MSEISQQYNGKSTSNTLTVKNGTIFIEMKH